MNANLKLIFGIPKLYQVVENLWGHVLEFQSDTESRIDRSSQATVSLEDRLTTQEAQMTEVLQILQDQGIAISAMAASLTAEPPERQRPYPRLHEINGRQGFTSVKRQTRQSSGAPR
ncbi:hypothetical protein Sjap_002730 [Stephania japonica]|uniref:Uncharacterized protein n=1 Tax=Stephania japonica TaxID=461633 RepID=A0AAP0KQ14_9MAGN